MQKFLLACSKEGSKSISSKFSSANFLQSLTFKEEIFSVNLDFPFGSSDAVEVEEVLNGPSTSMKFIHKYSHTLAAITQTNTPTHLFNYMLLSFCVCAFPFYQHHIIQHLSIGPPLSPVSTSRHFNVTIHAQTGVAHWLICLCHAVAVTADILIWLPKMSANYLHTMHHNPFSTSLLFSLVQEHFCFCCIILFFQERQ